MNLAFGEGGRKSAIAHHGNKGHDSAIEMDQYTDSLLLHPGDHKLVDGWDFLLQPGTQDFVVTAPMEPGNYEVVCTVICSANHENMSMKFTVLPGDK